MYQGQGGQINNEIWGEILIVEAVLPLSEAVFKSSEGRLIYITSVSSLSLSLCRPRQFPDIFLQSSWWIITKLGMWVGIATLLNPIYCRSGRMHRRHAPLTLMAKNASNRGFQAFSDRVVDGSSPNLVCGLVLPPYWTLFTAVPVGCTHHAWVSLGLYQVRLGCFSPSFFFHLIFF